MSSLRDKLRTAIAENLPGERAHLPMLPLNRAISSEALKDVKEYKTSAVSVVIHESPVAYQIILIQRPTYDGAHSGQVAFPGGKMDPLDSTHEYTARRECFEEIGLILTDDHYLGKLTDVYIPVSGFLMHPHVYYLTEQLFFTPDPREVESIILADIDDFAKENNIVRRNIPMGKGVVLKNTPGFVVQEKFIWGATALVLNELCEIVRHLKI